MSFHHLTRDNRVELGALWRANHTKAEIARALGKHRGTIGRELARKLETNTAEAFREAVQGMFADIPVELRRTLTLDNGTEMNAFEALEEATRTTVYFAQPYHAWERGTNENTNGLLRQYFPKKTSLTVVTQAEVDRAVIRLNTRPRKRLGYMSPQTVFYSRVAIRV